MAQPRVRCEAARSERARLWSLQTYGLAQPLACSRTAAAAALPDASAAALPPHRPAAAATAANATADARCTAKSRPFRPFSIFAFYSCRTLKLNPTPA